MDAMEADAIGIDPNGEARLSLVAALPRVRALWAGRVMLPKMRALEAHALAGEDFVYRGH